MPKYLLKRFLWLLLLLLAIVGAWSMFSGVDSLIGYYHQGADPASALHIVPNIPLDLHVRLKWQSDDADTGRVLEPITRTDIQSAYLRAWLQWNLSLLKNEPYGLQTYFDGPALADVSNSLHEVATQGWLVEQADMTHSLQLHFYSADGSIVSFTDSAASVVTMLHQKDGSIAYTGETVVSYQAVMLLEDGNWRVRQWVKIGNQPLSNFVPPRQTPPSFVGVDAHHAVLLLDGKPFRIVGMNYYPRDSAWDRFWLHYDPFVIDHDFRLMQTLGMNTIRVFLPFDQFGGANLSNHSNAQTGDTSTSVSQNMLVVDPLAEVTDLLTRASIYQLHVIVTLFDFHSDYTLLHWPDADRYLETLLIRFKNTPSILAWDLKNEPDRDYSTSKQYLVDAWLTHVAAFARIYDPHHLLTIGWSSPQAAQTHIPGIDFVSFHYYAPTATLDSAYNSIRKAVPTQPIVLEEFGLSTWNSFFFPNGHTEAEQAVYYAAILRYLRNSDSSGYLAWTLYDFSYVPSTVAGRWPWQTGPQKALGIIRLNETFKPAAHLLAPNASLRVSVTTPQMALLKPFWLTVSIVVLLGSTLLIFLMRRTYQHKRSVQAG